MKTMLVAALAAAAWGGELKAGTIFSDDVEFLKKHVEVVVLHDADRLAEVALVPAYQGRVMTSTAGGAAGISYGWVNRELIASGKFQPHINVFGGEDRFWIGPEGGQFSVFFAKGVPFDLEHWFTPAPIDTEPFEVVRQTDELAVFRRQFQLTNTTGTKFDLEVTREIRLLSSKRVADQLGIAIPRDVKLVAFESENTLKNTGKTGWTKDTGLLSIWILGMFNASPSTTVVIPFQPVAGKTINDAYFGKVPADRLVVKDGMVFFKADANHRSKIGVPPGCAKDTLGSYDPKNKVLTIAQFTLPRGATNYVNSMWEIQKEPFAGDVVNSYNDGPPPTGGKQLGQFYELETSSPALALAPGASATHVHRTIHLQGDEKHLDSIARNVLGMSLAEIKTALK